MQEATPSPPSRATSPPRRTCCASTSSRCGELVYSHNAMRAEWCVFSGDRHRRRNDSATALREASEPWCCLRDDLKVSIPSCGLFLRLISVSRHPDDLYKNGIQRSSFVPCIELLKERFEVTDLDSGTGMLFSCAAPRGLADVTKIIAAYPDHYPTYIMTLSLRRTRPRSISSSGLSPPTLLTPPFPIGSYIPGVARSLFPKAQAQWQSSASSTSAASP